MPLPRTALLPFVLLVALGLAGAGCPSSDDDDDSGEGEGEGEGETCDPRTCSGAGEHCCDTASGTSCINTTNNFQHCGECGAACTAGTANLCVGGECSCGESAPCDGSQESTCCPVPGEPAQCSNLLTDADNCGGCNTTCVAPGVPEKQSDRCLDGGCVCGDTGEACDGQISSICCPDEGGGASCHNTLTDLENCGGCSLADRVDPRDGEPDTQYRCDPLMANICRLASCVCGIPEDIGQDPAPCLGTRASTCCAPADPRDADLAICADLDTDEEHCGACNAPCTKGQTCVAGDCAD